MSSSRTPQERWQGVIFTHHASQRLAEEGMTEHEAAQVLLESTQEILSPDIVKRKEKKYSPEKQQHVSHWRYGTLIFTVIEESEGEAIVLTMVNQQVAGLRFRGRRRSDKLRGYQAHRGRRNDDVRLDKKWR